MDKRKEEASSRVCCTEAGENTDGENVEINGKILLFIMMILRVHDY